jgi:hypothetical protein
MRLSGIFLVVGLAVIAFADPVAAQPKVTITGFIDHVSSWTNNLSQSDLNLARHKDAEWYSRTRVRPDITAEVGTTKFVLGIEIDESWGQAGNVGAATSCGGTATGVAGTQCSFPTRFGQSAGWQLNTDTMGVLEIKWAYTEFDLPIMPIPTRVRLGAQPWEVMYKPGVLATGDFAGVHVTNQWGPMVKSNVTFAQIEESSTGPRDAFIRGDDFALFASVEVTPFKGLDLRPIFSYANFIGVTSASSRQNRGGLGSGAAAFPTCPGTAGPGTGGCLGGGISSAIEDRFTVGLDAEWRFGPFSLGPTVFYQFGSRDQISPIPSLTSSPGVMTTLKRDAWYIDLRGGWQAGPLLIEALGIYTTGNTAGDRIDLNRSRLKYYEPISTDNGGVTGFTELQGGGHIDYSNRIRANAGSLNPGVAIGYDKYGLIVGGLRASYALTPTFTLRTMASARWTAEEVDTASTVAAGTGLTPRCAPAFLDTGRCVDRGTARFYGTELDLGFRWRLAPNVVFDLVGAYFFAGHVLSSPAITNTATGVVSDGRGPKDVQAVSARVRYSF